jgi:hypothetical protein
LLRDFIDAVRVESDVFLDLRNSRIRILIRPPGIERLLATPPNTVVVAIAFIRAVGGVIGPL